MPHIVRFEYAKALQKCPFRNAFAHCLAYQATYAVAHEATHLLKATLLHTHLRKGMVNARPQILKRIG